MEAAADEAEGEAEGAELALDLAVGCGIAGRVAPRAGAPPPAATLQPPEFRGLEGDSEYALKPFHNLAVHASFLQHP